MKQNKKKIFKVQLLISNETSEFKQKIKLNYFYIYNYDALII